MKPPVSGLMWLEKAIAAKQKLHEGEACNEGDIRYFVLTEIVQLLRQFPGGITKAVACTHLSRLWQQKTVDDRAKRKGQAASFTAFECISGLRSRKDESAFCLEAAIEAVKQEEGQPSSAVLREEDRNRHKIDAFLPYLEQTAQDQAFSLKGGERVRLAECKYIRSSGILQHVVVATKLMVLCVDTPQQAERLLHSSLCSPSQIVDMPGPEGCEQVIGGLLHAVVRKKAMPDGVLGFWLEDPFMNDPELALGLSLRQEEKSYLNILENGEEIFVKDPMATKGKAGLLPSLRLSAESFICVRSKKGTEELVPIGKGSCSRGKKHGDANLQVLTGKVLAFDWAVGREHFTVCLQDADVKWEVKVKVCNESLRFLKSTQPGHLVIIAGACEDVQSQYLKDAESNQDKPVQRYIWEQRKGSILQSLTGLIGLLNSPAIAGSNSEQSNGFFLEANIKDIFLEGVDQVHSSCGRPVKKISLSLDDFFDQEDLPSETPADPTAEDKPSQAEDCKEEGSQAVLHQDSDQQYGDSHSFCSMYQCSFCHEECFASKVSQCLTLSLDVEKQKGDVMKVKAAGIAAEDILGLPASSFLSLSKKNQALLRERLSTQYLRASLSWEPGLSPSEKPDLGRVEMLGGCN